MNGSECAHDNRSFWYRRQSEAAILITERVERMAQDRQVNWAFAALVDFALDVDNALRLVEFEHALFARSEQPRTSALEPRGKTVGLGFAAGSLVQCRTGERKPTRVAAGAGMRQGAVGLASRQSI